MLRSISSRIAKNISKANERPLEKFLLDVHKIYCDKFCNFPSINSTEKKMLKLTFCCILYILLSNIISCNDYIWTWVTILATSLRVLASTVCRGQFVSPAQKRIRLLSTNLKMAMSSSFCGTDCKVEYFPNTRRNSHFNKVISNTHPLASSIIWTKNTFCYENLRFKLILRRNN